MNAGAVPNNTKKIKSKHQLFSSYLGALGVSVVAFNILAQTETNSSRRFAAFAIAFSFIFRMITGLA